MRTQFIAILLIAAAWPAMATCRAPKDHVEERQCAERDATRLSHDISVSQQLVRTQISRWDEDAGFKAKALDLFNKSSDQFKAYRTQQCEFEASSAAGGNGASDMRLDCEIRLNRAYLEALQVQASWFEGPHA